tara:strand:- start:37 stop:471 length:435 start_codon:yes stop_codon:yes gene_type:complete
MENNNIEYISIYPWLLIDDNKLNLMICKPNNNKEIMYKESENLIIDQIKKKNLKPFLLEILGYIRNNLMNYTDGNRKVGFLDKNDEYIFIFTINNKIIIQKSNVNSNEKSLCYMSNLIKNSPNGAGYIDLHNNEYNVLICDEEN